jgi:aspartate kinase
VFEKYRTPIDMITTSEVAVSLTIDNPANLEAIIRELDPFGELEVTRDQTIIAIVGNELAQTRDILAKLFGALTPVQIRMVSYGGSNHNISILIDGSQKKETLQLLNRGLFGLD